MIWNSRSHALEQDRTRFRYTPLLPIPLARGVSKVCRVSQTCLGITDAGVSQLIRFGRRTSIYTLQIFERSASGYLYSAVSDLDEALAGRDVSLASETATSERAYFAKRAEKLVTGISTATTAAAFGLAVGFQVTFDVAGHAFALAQSWLRSVDVILGYNETSQAVASILREVRTEIHPEISCKRLACTAVVFIMLLQRHGNLAPTTDELHVLWDSLIREHDGKVSTDIVASPETAVPKSDIGAIISQSLGETGDAPWEEIPYELEITEYTKQVIRLTAENVSKEWDQTFVKRRKQLGLYSSELSQGSQSISEPGNLGLPIPLRNQYARDTADLIRYRKHQSASYGRVFLYFTGLSTTVLSHDEHTAFAEHCGIPAQDIVYSSFVEPQANRFSSAPVMFFITAENDQRRLVVTLRGTLDLVDILTDAMCSYTSFVWGSRTWKAHAGMLRSARLLLSSPLMNALRAVLETHQGYSVVFTGHSLGAGVAALICILLSNPPEPGTETAVVGQGYLIPEGTPISAVCYGPPATLDPELAKLTGHMIKSVVHSDDIIPFLSLGLLWDLKHIATILDETKTLGIRRPRKAFTAYKQQQSGSKYLLQRLRSSMTSEKLVPPGIVYRVKVHEHRDLNHIPESAQDGHRLDIPASVSRHIVFTVVKDPEQYFAVPKLSSQTFQHSPVYYEHSMDVLKKATEFSTKR